MEDIGTFQVAVGAIIARPDGKVLLVKRAAALNTPDRRIWEYPVGRLQQFEPFEDGLRREVLEETGISDLQILSPVSYFTFMRHGDTAECEVKGIVFACVTNETNVALSEEHDEHKWLDIDQAIAIETKPEIQLDFKRYKTFLARIN